VGVLLTPLCLSARLTISPEFFLSAEIDTTQIIKMGDADALPDYVLDPNAVLNDKDAAWRHGAPPDYSKTRVFYEESMHPTLNPWMLMED
jgi:hypothetical protein